MRRATWGVLTLIVALFVPGAVAGQVAWDSPMLMPPRSQPGFGLFLLGPAGGDLGVMGLWRSPSWNFGVRGGVAEESRGPDDDIAIFAGVDFDGGLTRSSPDFPLDVDWLLGVGFSVGDDLLISVPAGLTFGHSFTGDGVVFTPYGTPRVVFDAFFGDEERDDDVGLDLGFDIGLDLRFSQNFTVRFGATIGDREAVAIGVVF